MVAREIEFTFPNEGVSARAVLLEDQAPRTCRAMWELLPVEGEAFHAMVSGTIGAILLDPGVVVEAENTATCLQTGDVLFTHYDGNWRHGWPEPLSEIYWAYDRYARPTVPYLFTTAVGNVFGRFVGDASAFFAVSRRIHREGWKQLTVRRAE